MAKRKPKTPDQISSIEAPQKHLGGRPKGSRDVELTLEDYKRIETFAGIGLRIADIAACVGVSKATFERRMNDTPGVSEAVSRGRGIANSNVASVAYKMAMSGKNSDMTKFWLRTQGGFQETQKVELTGADGGPVELTAITAEERMRRIKELDEKLQLTGEDDE